MSEFKLDIEVYFERDDGVTIAASTDPNKLSGLASSEFDEFTTNVYATLDYCGFEVTDVEYSNVVNSNSTYFTAYKRSESTAKDIKCIIFIRLSDHAMDDRKKKWQDTYWKNKAQELKQPKTKVRQKWKFRSIVVNNEVYASYDEALEAIEQMLEKL